MADDFKRSRRYGSNFVPLRNFRHDFGRGDLFFSHGQNSSAEDLREILCRRDSRFARFDVADAFLLRNFCAEQHFAGNRRRHNFFNAYGGTRRGNFALGVDVC